jgi:type IV conjugative transfer system protein TraL
MKRRFPQYLSSPFQVLWFETDELGIIFLFLTVGLIYGGWSWLLLLAGPYAYSRLKHKYPRGFLRHLLYFMGLISMKGYPSYFEKEFIG